MGEESHREARRRLRDYDRGEFPLYSVPSIPFIGITDAIRWEFLPFYPVSVLFVPFAVED